MEKRAEKRAEDLTWGLLIGAEKPSLQSQRRLRAKKSTTLKITAPAKNKQMRIAQSSDDDSDDTTDESRTKPASAASKTRTTLTAPETQAH